MPKPLTLRTTRPTVLPTALLCVLALVCATVAAAPAAGIANATVAMAPPAQALPAQAAAPVAALVRPAQLIVTQLPTDGAFNFSGGGFGHGVGMSQYGALGRAYAGHSHTEILDFYFPGTTLEVAPERVPDDINVRIAVHNETVFTPSGLVTVLMDGKFLDTTRNRLTIRRGNGGWYINSSNIDWCRGFCPGSIITVTFNQGETVRVSGISNDGKEYAYGQFELTPAATGADNCGSARSGHYCLVVAGLTMQQYLYGVDEMPVRWHPEALKAQVIAARSFAVARTADRRDSGEVFDLYNSVTDQEYHAWTHEEEAERYVDWRSLVDSTDDMVLTYPNSEDDPDSGREVVPTYYSASNGGYTAAAEVPWNTPVAYLVAQPDPFDAAVNEEGEPSNPWHQWYRSYPVDDVSRWLEEYTYADLGVGQLQEIQIEGASESGRIDDALVTLVGSARTLEVRDSDGEPFGYRFYYAMLQGCRRTADCAPFNSTKIAPAGLVPSDFVEVPTGDLDPSGDQQIDLDEDAARAELSGRVFSDVPADAPYLEAVTWLASQGLTTGTSGTPGTADATFSPDAPLTRAQFATFLWRLAGRPDPRPGTPPYGGFEDLHEGAFYVGPVVWMASLGITVGCGASRFCPHDQLTAAQTTAFLWRYAGHLDGGSAIPFHDVESNSFYLEAVRWMLDWDLWVDDDYNPPNFQTVNFNPHEPIPRAKMAVYLWNLARAPGAFSEDAVLPPLTRWV